MRPSIRSRLIALVRGQWAGLLALFLVIAGGTAYAANTVFSTDIVDGEVKSADLANNAVRSNKVADGQITATDLAPPDPWRRVRAGSTDTNACQDSGVVGMFCSYQVTPTHADPWQNYGPPYASAAFYKDQLGIVHLRGLLNWNHFTISADPQVTPIFRLPAAYRPDHDRIFTSVAEDLNDEWLVAPARVDVRADGVVAAVADCSTTISICSGNATYLTLDGISFRPDE